MNEFIREIFIIYLLELIFYDLFIFMIFNLLILLIIIHN